MFKDRVDAGKKLAEVLKSHHIENGVVIGLPRGGVVLAYEVSKLLGFPLDIMCPRKIGAPFNPEYAIGAVTETGQHLLDELNIDVLGISSEYIANQIEAECKQAQHRLNVFRKGRPPRDLKDKTVILVDDGLATGMTMKAAILSAKSEGVKKIIVAVPVAPADSVAEIEQLVDEVVCLSIPSTFYAVGQFYQEFHPVEDQEVIDLLK